MFCRLDDEEACRFRGIFRPSTVMDALILLQTPDRDSGHFGFGGKEDYLVRLSAAKASELYNNVEGNQKGMVLMGQAMTSLTKPNLYDLFMLHAAARGHFVETRTRQTVFSVHEGITPFDISKIMAEFIA